MKLSIGLVQLLLLGSGWSSERTCPIEQPKLIIDYSRLPTDTIVNNGADFVDLRVGSNLTITCVGDHQTDRHIEWLLPEYHPVIPGPSQLTD